MGGFGTAMRAIGIGELFPAAHAAGEAVERQGAGMVEQKPEVVGEAVAAARVGAGGGKGAHLGDTDRAGTQGVADLGRVGDQPGRAQAVDDIGIGPAHLGPQHAPDRRVAVGPEGTGAIECADHPGQVGLDSPVLRLERVQPLTKLLRPKQAEIVEWVSEHEPHTIEQMFVGPPLAKVASERSRPRRRAHRGLPRSVVSISRRAIARRMGQGGAMVEGRA